MFLYVFIKKGSLAMYSGSNTSNNWQIWLSCMHKCIPLLVLRFLCARHSAPSYFLGAIFCWTSISTCSTKNWRQTPRACAQTRKISAKLFATCLCTNAKNWRQTICHVLVHKRRIQNVKIQIVDIQMQTLLINVSKPDLINYVILCTDAALVL
jgi:hypothetical protein